jgi:hypothetical protein
MSSALQFLDSMTHYATADGGLKWTTFSASITPDAGRSFPDYSAMETNGEGSASLTFPSNGFYVCVVGAAYKTQAFDNPIHILYQGGNGNNPIALTHVGDGRLIVTGGGNPISAPSSIVLHLNVWYYVELVYQMTGSGLYVAIYVNGQLVASNTVSTSNYYATSYANSGPGGGNSALFCDLYINGSATLDDTPLIYGDTAVGLQRPDSDEGTNQWTPTSGGNHYAMVDDVTPDYLTTTLTDTGTGTTDIHGMSSVPDGATILGTQGVMCVEKSAAGTGTFEMIYRDGGTNYPSAGFNPSSGQFLYFLDPRSVSPATGLAWTAAELNALSFGISRTA